MPVAAPPIRSPDDKELVRYSLQLGARGVRHLAGKEAFWRLWMPLDVDRVVELPWTAGQIVAQSPDRVLDVASPKLLACWLADRAGLEVVATDLWEAEVESWSRLVGANINASPGLGRLSLEVADATSLQYEDSSFDAIFSTSVIEHIPDRGDEEAMSEFERVLRPGGVVALTFPMRERMEDQFVEHDLYGQRYKGDPIFFQRHYSPEAVNDRLLGDRAFEIVERVVWRKDAPREQHQTLDRLAPARLQLGRLLGPLLPRMGRQVMRPTSFDLLGPDNVMGLLLRRI